MFLQFSIFAHNGWIDRVYRPIAQSDLQLQEHTYVGILWNDLIIGFGDYTEHAHRVHSSALCLLSDFIKLVLYWSDLIFQRVFLVFFIKTK